MNIQEIRRVLQRNKLNSLNNQVPKIINAETSNKIQITNSNKQNQLEDLFPNDILRREYNNLRRLGNPDIPIKLNQMSRINLDIKDNQNSVIISKGNGGKKLSEKKKIKILTNKIYSNEEELDSQENELENSEAKLNDNKMNQQILSTKQSKKKVLSGISPKKLFDLNKNSRNREVDNHCKSLDFRYFDDFKNSNPLLQVNVKKKELNQFSNNHNLINKDIRNHFDHRAQPSLPSSVGTDISLKLPKILEKLQKKYQFNQPNSGSNISINSISKRKDISQLNFNYDNTGNLKSIKDKRINNQNMNETNVYNNDCIFPNNLNLQNTNNIDTIYKIPKTMAASKTKKSGCGCFSFC